jgi:SAM-dependent methyltransferase
MTNDLSTRVRREYAAEAARYDRRWAGYLRASTALLRPWLAEDPPRAMLDVGCGTGYLLHALRGWGMEPARYLGVDPSREMLRRAAGRGAAVARGTAEALPVRTAAWEAVATVSSFHCWAEPGAGAAELRRVLAPGGRAWVVDWSRDFLRMRLLDAYMRRAGYAYARTYAEREARAILAGAGLRVTRSRRGTAGALWGLWALEARAD